MFDLYYALDYEWFSKAELVTMSRSSAALHVLTQLSNKFQRKNGVWYGKFYVRTLMGLLMDAPLSECQMVSHAPSTKPDTGTHNLLKYPSVITTYLQPMWVDESL